MIAEEKRDHSQTHFHSPPSEKTHSISRSFVYSFVQWWWWWNEGKWMDDKSVCVCCFGSVRGIQIEKRKQQLELSKNGQTRKQNGTHTIWSKICFIHADQQSKCRLDRRRGVTVWNENQMLCVLFCFPSHLKKISTTTFCVCYCSFFWKRRRAGGWQH